MTSDNRRASFESRSQHVSRPRPGLKTSVQILLRNRKCIDAKAIKKTTLLDWIEELPPGYFVTCDCTYSISEHLIGLYSGVE
jgi:hypothetical protein